MWCWASFLRLFRSTLLTFSHSLEVAQDCVGRPCWPSRLYARCCVCFSRLFGSTLLTFSHSLEVAQDSVGRPCWPSWLSTRCCARFLRLFRLTLLTFSHSLEVAQDSVKWNQVVTVVFSRLVFRALDMLLFDVKHGFSLLTVLRSLLEIVQVDSVDLLTCSWNSPG